MNAMRNLLKSRSGFTLVELMVVVVVLGILAGIAVQRMGDVRDRAEQAADDANARLLLGSANLAKVMNYTGGSDEDNEINNFIIRWERPKNASGETQVAARNVVFEWDAEATEPDWVDVTTDITVVPGEDWDFASYVEAFPVGYAVEIVFGAGQPEDVGGPGDDDFHGFETNEDDYDGEIIMVFKHQGGTDGGEYDNTVANWDRIFPED